MVNVTCPWCELEVPVEADLGTAELDCPDCATSWLLAAPDAGLALAA